MRPPMDKRNSAERKGIAGEQARASVASSASGVLDWAQIQRMRSSARSGLPGVRPAAAKAAPSSSTPCWRNPLSRFFQSGEGEPVALKGEGARGPRAIILDEKRHSAKSLRRAHRDDGASSPACRRDSGKQAAAASKKPRWASAAGTPKQPARGKLPFKAHALKNRVASFALQSFQRTSSAEGLKVIARSEGNNPPASAAANAHRRAPFFA